MDWILCLLVGALAGSLVSMTGSGAGFLLLLDWATFIWLGPRSIVGGAAGAVVATHLDTAILELLFIVFAVALSGRLLRRHRKIEPKERPTLACGSREAPRWACWPR
jgi:uncharacterized membrane protein YfcA